MRFVCDRMRAHFGYVAEPKILNRRGAPLYGLVFAVASQNPKAIALARRVAKDIFSKLH
jgi:hypothetical protein